MDPANPESKSALDLVIESKELFQYVDKMEIDNGGKMTAFKCNKKGKTLSFPDHYSILTTFKGIPEKRRFPSLGKKFTTWNTNKVNGWENYKLLTTSNKKLDNIANSSSTDPDYLMNEIDKELKSIKYKAF